MDDLDELWRALDRISATPRLLVACDFDGALAPDLGDPDGARAEQLSSESLNILQALADTTVAVVSRRDPSEVFEMMLLSGAKGGLRFVGPEDLDRLRADVGATGAVRVSCAGEEQPSLQAGDLGVTVLNDAPPPVAGSGFLVEDTEAAADVLEELARLRRGT